MSPPLCRGVGDLLSVLGKALGQGMSPTLPILLHVSGDGSQPALEGVRLSLARPLSPPAGRAGLSHSRREGCAEAMGEKRIAEEQVLGLVRFFAEWRFVERHFRGQGWHGAS